jgi:hypothetical protein
MANLLGSSDRHEPTEFEDATLGACVIPPPLMLCILEHVRDFPTLEALQGASRWLYREGRAHWERLFGLRQGMWLFKGPEDASWKRRFLQAQFVSGPDNKDCLVEALNRAQVTGATILVCPGRYLITPVDVSEPLTIEGVGFNKRHMARLAQQSLGARSMDAVQLPDMAPNIVLWNNDYIPITWLARGGHVKNLAVSFEASAETDWCPALEVESGKFVRLTNCDLYSHRHSAVYVDEGGALAAVGCYFHSDCGHGVYQKRGSVVALERCFCCFNSYSGVENNGGALRLHQCVLGRNCHNGIG